MNVHFEVLICHARGDDQWQLEICIHREGKNRFMLQITNHTVTYFSNLSNHVLQDREKTAPSRTFFLPK
jgi:hypothetical protein